MRLSTTAANEKIVTKRHSFIVIHSPPTTRARSKTQKHRKPRKSQNFFPELFKPKFLIFDIRDFQDCRGFRVFNLPTFHFLKYFFVNIWKWAVLCIFLYRFSIVSKPFKSVFSFNENAKYLKCHTSPNTRKHAENTVSLYMISLFLWINATPNLKSN